MIQVTNNESVMGVSTIRRLKSLTIYKSERQYKSQSLKETGGVTIIMSHNPQLLSEMYVSTSHSSQEVVIHEPPSFIEVTYKSYV